MNNKWKWFVGIALAAIVLVVPLFAPIFFPNNGYRMMGYDYIWHMPMMYGTPGMMFLVWLILLGLLIVIGLGIAWLVKSLTAAK